MRPPPTGRSRRRFLGLLASTGALSLAGCTTFWRQPGATDVLVYNVASEAKVVSITITDAGEGTVLADRTLEMAPNEKVDPVNDGKLPLTTDYTVEVRVEGGPSETFEWDDPEVGQAPLWVLVDDSRNIRFLLEAG